MKLKCTITAFCLMVVTCYPCLAEDFVLIVNKSNPQSTLSKRDARYIFLGKKKTWPHGRAIVVSVQKDIDTKSSFTKEIVNKSPQQYQVYWKKILFTGSGIPPITLENNAEVKDFVASDEKAIGYIDRSALDNSVKELEIN